MSKARRKLADHPGMTIRVYRVTAAGERIEGAPTATLPPSRAPIMAPLVYPPCGCARCVDCS
jgi:hypothetical protein